MFVAVLFFDNLDGLFVVLFLDPNEVDKQELMAKTKMSLSQITVWFTNARVKMRKENKLPLNLYAKKKKKKQADDSFHLDDTLSPPFSAQNLSFNGKEKSYFNHSGFDEIISHNSKCLRTEV